MGGEEIGVRERGREGKVGGGGDRGIEGGVGERASGREKTFFVFVLFYTQ